MLRVSRIVVVLMSMVLVALTSTALAQQPPKKTDEKSEKTKGSEEKGTEAKPPEKKAGEDEKKSDAPPQGLTPDPKERATKLANEGGELAGKGQLKEAASKYEESIRVFPILQVYYNLAYVYEQMGQWKGCSQNYKKYLEEYRKAHSGADPAEIIGIKRSIEKCKESLQPPIEITSDPPGARVALGKETNLIGTSPVKQKIDPGFYKLFIMKDGYNPVKTQIQVRAGQPGKFHFTLRKVVHVGKVSVKVNVKDATIYIDGKNFGLSPYRETPELEAGKHQIVIKKDRYTTINQTFDVKTGKVTPLRYELFLNDPPPSWRSYLGWASVSIGAVAIAGGVVAYKFADDQFNDTDDFDQFILLQNLGYGLGGGLMGLGTVLLIWEAFTSAVDDADIIDMDAQVPPVQFGVAPINGGVYINGSVRF